MLNHSHSAALGDSRGGSCHPDAWAWVLTLATCLVTWVDYLIFLCLICPHSPTPVSKTGIYNCTCSFHQVRQLNCSEQRYCVVGAQSGSAPLCWWLSCHVQALLFMNRAENKSRRDSSADCSRSCVRWLVDEGGGVAYWAQEKSELSLSRNCFLPIRLSMKFGTTLIRSFTSLLSRDWILVDTPLLFGRAMRYVALCGTDRLVSYPSYTILSARLCQW